MKNLYKALASFQQGCPAIHKDTKGYGYTYADLPTILEKINPLLKIWGIGFYQSVEGNKVKTVVFHVDSGESIESNTDIPQGVQLKGMNDFQVLGSAITYIRRYALSSLLGIVTDKDNDASGEQIKDISKEVPFGADESKGEFESLGNCENCGAENIIYKTGKIGCSKYCWRK